MKTVTAVTATAPPSIGNCAAGFDVLGHSLEGPTDRVTCTRAEHSSVTVTSVQGTTASLPRDPERNTASRAVLELRRLGGFEDLGMTLQIHKGIPLASGMGGSAASSVAAVIAANELLPTRQPVNVLYAAACAGEAAASGAPHGDNVAPCLLGGLVIAPKEGAPVSLSVPDWLHVALVHPRDRHVQAVDVAHGDRRQREHDRSVAISLVVTQKVDQVRRLSRLPAELCGG